jgi:hypothetical protein
MNYQEILNWLLQGDVSIQYQVHRDLLNDIRKDLQERIAQEGWGFQFLSKRKDDGNWGDRFYQPKWKSTHYTLLDLKHLCLPPSNTPVQESLQRILKTLKAEDGGIKLGPSTAHRSDVCVNGMFLHYASYFGAPEKELHSVVDSLLNERMLDGGFNCRSTRSGAKHSSMHSTVSVSEGFAEYKKTGYSYRIKEVQKALDSSTEFILLHRLFKSDHTGEIIHKNFLRLSFPGRWKYDILRALDHFQSNGIGWDERMRESVDVLLSKRKTSGLWNMQAAHPGKVHFVMEPAGKASRWNTLRALRVLKHFNILDDLK